MLAAAFASGSVPYSGLAARLLAGVDLRRHGSGTVSGTGLFEVAGFAPLAVAGSLDVAKGAVGPLLAGRDRPLLAVFAGGVSVAAHNWSPWLGYEGGRGISPALGVLLVQAPEGAGLLLGGLAAGRLFRQSGLGTLLALSALPSVLARRRGRDGLLVALAVVVPMVAKRLAGNRGTRSSAAATVTLRTLFLRLLFDRDTVGDRMRPNETS